MDEDSFREMMHISYTNNRDAAMPAIVRRLQRLYTQVQSSSLGTRSAPNTNSSSKTKGIARASANGQPTMAPVAKYTVARRVRRLFWVLAGSTTYENAKVLAYMANEEGKKAI